MPISVTKGSIGSKTVDVVETRVDGRRVDYYLDRKTHLPQRVVTFFESGRVWETYNFSDYRDINGIAECTEEGQNHLQINPAYDETTTPTID